MTELYRCATPSMAMKQLGIIAERNEKEERETIVFCDDTLTLEAEKAICDRMKGTFYTSVYTFSNYLGKFANGDDILSTQGSVMVLRKIIDENRKDLKLFGSLSAVDAVDSVYETISRFYASGIDSKKLLAALEKNGESATGDEILGKKMADVSLIFSKYEEYLSEHGKKDRAGRLGELPGLLRNDSSLSGKDVVFVGYREFSQTGKEILRAAMESAGNVKGIFCDGDEKFYSHVARKAFEDAATKSGKGFVFGKLEAEKKPGDGNGPEMEDAVSAESEREEKAGDGIEPEKKGDKKNTPSLDLPCEHLRKVIFDPSKRCDASRKLVISNEGEPNEEFLLYEGDGRVFMYEAGDSAEELEYIAAEIKKNVYEGLRYKQLAVMIPDVESARRDVEKIFARYGIPCYVDVKRTLLSHPLYAFVSNLVLCVYYGPSFSYMDDIVSSPYFPGSDDDKLAFRNYMVKYGNYKGAARRKANADYLMPRLGANATDKERAEARREAEDAARAVNSVRETFLKALKFFEDKKTAEIGETVYEGTRALFESDVFDVYGRSDGIYDSFKDEYPEEAEFSRRAPKALLEVLGEAVELGEGLSCREYLKVLKSGTYSKKLSLTPAKLDAVFVSDVSKTLFIDKKVVFAARMTEGVPGVSHDSRFISDRDIDKMAELLPDFGPKTEQDNIIRRETVALNICSFSDRLYLGYPVAVNGDEHQKSEVLNYVFYAFSWDGVEKPEEMKIKKVSELKKEVEAYYCSELIPAVMWTERGEGSEQKRLVAKRVLKEKFGESYDRLEAEAATPERERDSISPENGKRLYCSQGDDRYSPTTLESYFECPYKAFIEKGLKSGGKADDDTQAMDIGNLYHETFKQISDEYMNEKDCKRFGLKDKESFSKRAGDIVKEKLGKAPYSALVLTKRGEYDKQRLVDEMMEIAGELFEQLERSDFDIAKAETWCDFNLDDTYSIFGRVDRVDVASESEGDMVRVIDYKTGNKEASCRNYYLGNDLQLPLYLLAESEEMSSQPAGAFYFPAKIEYSKDGGNIVLNGFSDGTAETLEALDRDYESAEKKHVNAKCPKMTKDKKEKCGDPDAQLRYEFQDFLEYGRLLALGGIKEMSEGYIKPSPGKDACKYCGLKGCCGFELGRDGEERDPNATVDFKFVVDSVQASRESEDDEESKEEE